MAESIKLIVNFLTLLVWLGVTCFLVLTIIGFFLVIDDLWLGFGRKLLNNIS